MIPIAFDYKKATSVKEALSLLNDDAQLLGGGHSLIPALKLRLNAPEVLVDISKIETLKKITENEKSISIGACVTHGEIALSESIKKHCPMMVAAAKEIGDIQVRNCGTIGGSIAHADPAADWPAVLLAADAKITLQNKKSSRTVDVDQFFKGFYETALEEGEIITSISIPKTATNKNSAYAKFKQPASRFAIVGCAVAVEKDGRNVSKARIGLTGVADVAYRATNIENALKGKVLDTQTIVQVVRNAADGVSVMSDHYASEAYRSHLADVYVKRALTQLI